MRPSSSFELTDSNLQDVVGGVGDVEDDVFAHLFGHVVGCIFGVSGNVHQNS